MTELQQLALDGGPVAVREQPLRQLMPVQPVLQLLVFEFGMKHWHILPRSGDAAGS